MEIRNMRVEHKDSVMEMMREFYSSPAVYSSGSEEIFEIDIENCINDNPYIEGYVFVEGVDIIGYAMVAKSFSTEFGKQCIWIEDLYMKEACRGLGIGQKFLQFVKEKYPNAIFRLEVEEENTPALHVYKKGGYEVLPYMEMVKL